MDGLVELYQEMILEHSKAPRNFGRLDPHTHRAHGHNPLCGDQVEITLIVRDGRIDDVKFTGAGCAISTASASLMTEAVKGRPAEHAEALFTKLHHLLTTDDPPTDDLGKLQVFVGVRNFPMRVKCATLAWHTLNAALDDRGETVTTE